MATNRPVTIAALKRFADNRGSFFFSKGAMQFFNSQILSGVYLSTTEESKGYFVTSEQFDSESPRLFTVRVFDMNAEQMNIETVGEFQEYPTADEARTAAKRIAKGE